MTPLLIQFLLVLLIFPAVQFGTAVMTWRWRSFRRQRVNILWVITILFWGIWSTRLLTVYLGRDFDEITRYYWRVGTNYPLSLASTTLLVATTLYLSHNTHQRRWLFYAVGLSLTGLAFFLDPAIWAYDIPSFVLSNVKISHFTLWAIVWVGSVFVPLLWAWLIAEQSLRTVPPSLYRNQVAYWFMAITMAIFGGALALFQSNFIPQQVGALSFSVAAIIGMLAITQGQLANLQVILEQIGQQIWRLMFVSLILFFGLVVLFQLSGVGLVAVSTLLASAVILSILLFASNALLDRLMAGWQERPDINLDYVRQQFQIGGSLLTPEELARHFRQVIQTRLQAKEGWLLNVQETPGGGILLTSLVENGRFQPTLFNGDNPFVQYLYHNTSPLMQRDIDDLHTFNDMSLDERRALASWGKQVHIPIRSNSRLVALLTLAPKHNDEAYDRHDFTFLEDFAAQMGNLLVQSRHVHALRRVSEDVFERNLSLAQERRRLTELVDLYEQFAALLSPDLRRPFTQLEVELRQLESQVDQTVDGEPRTTEIDTLPVSPTIDASALGTMRHQVDESQAMVDNLIAIASHLEKQSQFEFGAVYMDGVVRSAIYQLRPMADARRVRLDFEIRGKMMPVWGDELRLQEAMQQLVHNAIKFNRIKGEVQIVCQMVRNEVRVQIVDYGVGIPPNRLDDLWQGLTKLFGADGKNGRRRTRIGLPLVKFIVQSHGGRVESRSTYGSGSTFTIYLPAVLEEFEESEPDNK